MTSSGAKMRDAASRSRFRAALLRWYDGHRRLLPWREGRDPYGVWISEVMLQQTRVAVVAERFPEFLRVFPDVHALAAAPVDKVLAAWSGLGYYRRARALHGAARIIVDEHAGRFPRTATGLARLPGIGRYTAAAIASIAFGEACAVVDGNVERVLERLHGRKFGSREHWQAAQELVSTTRPGDFNQAMMELGATICISGMPRCEQCPVRPWCATSAIGGYRPVRSGRADQQRRQQTVTYAFARKNGRILLVRRPADSRLMPGMWELPQVAAPGEVLLRLRHAITTTDYRITIVAAEAHGRWIPVTRLLQLPLTGLTRKVLRCLNII